MKPFSPLYLLFCLLLGCQSEAPVVELAVDVLPTPQKVIGKTGILSLKNSFNISVETEALNQLAKNGTRRY